ncbi:MAG: acyltransferase family protein, partial [Acidobacteriota bacterium]
MKHDIDAVFNRHSKSIFWSLVTVLILSLLILLNRNHLLNPWPIEEIKQVQPELGFAYTAQTKQPSLSSHNEPSLAKVLENGLPLPGPANSQHYDIRTFGNGRYSFWHDYVNFSSSDNSNPITNGRKYSYTYPIIASDLLAYSLYLVLITLLLVNARLAYLPNDSFQKKIVSHWVAVTSLKTIFQGRPTTMNYRPEVDGLRAVAVLPVILFHAGFEWMSGGYVGVDIFFVISGYLITTFIVNELDEGRFSIVGFYERRARRILPALFLVLACSLPVASFLLLPDQLISFSKSLGSVMTFVSNLYFRSEINYFARASEEEPLLHTWSLAVEEQYYLIFPLLAFLLWKIGRALFIAVMLLIALASFLYAESLSLLEPDKAFFDTRLRIWELLIGSLVAIYLVMRWRKAEKNRSIAEVGSALGLGLIIWAIFSFEKSTPFPGR